MMGDGVLFYMYKYVDVYMLRIRSGEPKEGFEIKGCGVPF